MAKMIFVNLPVADVANSTAFYEAIGFTHDTSFCKGAEAAMMVWSDTINFMLLDKARYADFTTKQIADAHATSAALFALALDSRVAVDEITAKAFAAGGRILHDAEDLGFMCSTGFEDLDGHGFGPFWMDVEAAMATMNQTEAA
jgi:predicted lactoylglutathione lyase